MLFLKPKYWEISWAIKIELCILKKFNNPIPTKLCANLINNYFIFVLFLVHDTVRWLNCVVHYLSVKIYQKMLEKINAQLFSALKWELVWKKFTSWAQKKSNVRYTGAVTVSARSPNWELTNSKCTDAAFAFSYRFTSFRVL